MLRLINNNVSEKVKVYGMIVWEVNILKLNKLTYTKTQLIIYSIAGKLIYKEDVNSLLDINLSEIVTLSSGSYLYKLISENKIQTGKFVKY